jgi:ligand-binding sensor domain-containing protein
MKLWIGTEYGLNKFDGVQFTQYLNKENDATSLLGNIVRELFVDRDQRLWVGCSNGLQYYLPEKDVFCTVPFEENLTPSVAEIVQLQNGEIWLVATGRGLFKVDRENNKVVALGNLFSRSSGHFLDNLALILYNPFQQFHVYILAHGGMGFLCG